MIILRQKEYMLHEITRGADGHLQLGAALSNGQGYSLNRNGNVTQKSALTNSANAAKEAENQAATAAQRQAKLDFVKQNPNAFKDVATRARTQGYAKGQAAGFEQGKKSVGILGGAKNTWNSLSKRQQIGVAAGGAALALGGATLIARNRRKRKEAEEELERERRRR